MDIIEITNSFFIFNGIKVNENKLELLIINNSIQSKEESWVTLGNNEIKIYPIKYDNQIKYLNI